MEQLEYITYKAMMECDQGSAPGFFTPSYNQTVKINSCKVATTMDKIPLTNVPNFVVCKKTQKPCVPATTNWSDTYAVKVKGQQTLIGKSCLGCSVGGKIKFSTSGQVPLSPEEEAQINGMRDDVKKAYDKEQEEKNKPWWQKAGEFIVDCVPVVGPVISMAKNISEGNWGMAALDAGFLALDVVGLVAAPFTGGASVAGATAVKIGARQAIKAGAKQVAKKLSKEALEAGAKQTAEMLSKLSVRNITAGRLCVFACFPAGTPVATKDGLRNIEDVRPGDEVWAYDEKTGEIGLKPVVHTFERAANVLVKIEVGGEVITATPEHPFHSNGQWKEAGLLEAGDDIQLLNGQTARVETVKYEGAHAPVEISHDIFTEPEEVNESSSKVYNFEVAGWHTYFVGLLKALVHNARPCLSKIKHLPDWLQQMWKGNYFNFIREQFYKRMGGFNEVVLQSGKRLDSYIPKKEIVSRKFSQLGKVTEETAKKHIDELVSKYSPGEAIKQTARNADAIAKGGTELSGKMILEVPVQKTPIPQSVLDHAKDAGVQIRDILGNIYR